MSGKDKINSSSHPGFHKLPKRKQERILKREEGKAARKGQAGTSGRKASLNKLLHEAKSTPRVFGGTRFNTAVNDTELQPYREALAKHLGLSAAGVKQYYTAYIAMKAHELGNGDPEKGAQEAFRFFSSSRIFGGRGMAVFDKGRYVNLLMRGNLYQTDLSVALSSLFRSIGRREDLQMIDLGCSKGLSTLSLLAIAKEIKTLIPNEAPQKIRLKALDLSQSNIDFAQAAVYSGSDFQDGIYDHKQALRIDETNYRAMLDKLSCDYSNGRDRLFGLINSVESALNQLLLKLFDRQDDGRFKLKESIFKDGELSYELMEPFDLSNVADSSQHLISAMNVLGLMSDAGQARLLEEIAKKLKPGGYLFTDMFFSTLAVGDVAADQAAHPLRTAVISKYFRYMENRLADRNPASMKILPGLLVRV